jgi:hypothetical protein
MTTSGRKVLGGEAGTRPIAGRLQARSKIPADTLPVSRDVSRGRDFTTRLTNNAVPNSEAHSERIGPSARRISMKARRLRYARLPVGV